MGDIKSPEVSILEAKNAYLRKDFSAAADAYQAAAASFSSKGDELSAAEMKNNASVAYLQAGNAELALDSALITDQVFASVGDTRRQAIALGNQAAAYEALGQLEAAAKAYESSSDLLKLIGDKELRPTVMRSLSSIQLRLGRQMEALVTMQAGLNQIENPSLMQRLMKKIIQSPFNYFNRSS
jgi:tetratricopeptide (TPR) repeat protein